MFLIKFQLILDDTKEEAVVVTAHARSTLTDQIEALVLEHSSEHLLTGYTEDDLVLLSVESIACITVQDGKTFAIDSAGERYRLKQRLYELEVQLPPSFIRINKSALANEAQLDRFVATYAGGINARFQNGYEEYVSRRCFATIKRRYKSK